MRIQLDFFSFFWQNGTRRRAGAGLAVHGAGPAVLFFALRRNDRETVRQVNQVRTNCDGGMVQNLL